MAVDSSVSKIFHFYYTRTMDVLTKHNPSGIQNIGSLLRQFPGKEHVVYSQICKNCGIKPEKKPTLDEIETWLRLRLNGNKKVSSWLIGKGFNIYAEQLQFKTMSWESFLSISTEKQLKELLVEAEHIHPLLTAICLETSGTEKVIDKQSHKPKPNKPVKKPDFDIGENCFTKVLRYSEKKEQEEIWLNAKVTNFNEENSTYDILVYNAEAHGVPPEAVHVPRNYLKKSTDQVVLAEPRRPLLPKYHPGDRVRVIGLRSHPLYNGLCGTIQHHMAKERRYQVQLDTGDVFAIRSRNISPEVVELPIEAVEAGKKKLKEVGKESQADEASFSLLLEDLYRSSPDTDHVKIGEFAAGYYIAKQKILSSKQRKYAH